MKTGWSRSIRVWLIVMILGIGALTTAPVFSPSGTPMASAQAASCSDAGCEGKDPAATGCSNDAYTPVATNVWRNGVNIGRVDLRYSPACGTNWTRVVSYIGSVYLYGEVWDHDSSQSYSVVSSSMYTNMVAARHHQACGKGYIDGAWSVSICA